MSFLDVARGSFIDHIPEVLPGLKLTDILVLAGNGKAYQQKTMPIELAGIIAAGKPTRVTQGIFHGFSLPIGGIDEELYACQCIPAGWDGSTMYLYVGGWLDTANDGFRL